MSEQPVTSTLRRSIGMALSLSKPFFTSKERRIAWSLLIAVIAIELGIVYILVIFNAWNASFYNALQERDWPVFIQQLGVFVMIIAVFLPFAVLQTYLNQWLNIRWRSFMTERYLAGFLAEGRHYRMHVSGDAADNPDQRIAEDVRLFVSRSLELSVGLLGQIVTFLSFVVILWGLSAAAPIVIGGVDYSIPGYLVWAALAYAVAGTLITHVIGRPLIGLNFTQQKVEADFRYGLVRVRENTEAIALSKGEPAERATLSKLFSGIRQNWFDLMSRQAKMTFFTAAYGQVSSIFAILVLAPAYFAGKIQLGALFQTTQAFSQVQSALSYFITSYQRLAEWKAVVDRLDGFEAAIRLSDVTPDPAVQITEGDEISADGVVARLPDGRILTAPATLVVQRGQHVVVSGPSGSGKTTLFRVLTGIWPWGLGRVSLPSPSTVMALPQRPYMPLGTLKAALAYPHPPETVTDEAAAEVLTALGLGKLIDGLGVEAPWGQSLSGGEQQRVQIARALLAKPDWLLLDEALSALDPDMERRVVKLIEERLPTTTILSIAHRLPDGARVDRTVALNAVTA